jgi:hypothetical protein
MIGISVGARNRSKELSNRRPSASNGSEFSRKPRKISESRSRDGGCEIISEERFDPSHRPSNRRQWL